MSSDKAGTEGLVPLLEQDLSAEGLFFALFFSFTFAISLSTSLTISADLTGDTGLPEECARSDGVWVGFFPPSSLVSINSPKTCPLS